MKERRGTSRHRTLRGGTILFNNKKSGIDCLIRNVSESGACVEVDNPVGPPEQFDLLIAGEDATRKCEVAQAMSLPS